MELEGLTHLDERPLVTSVGSSQPRNRLLRALDPDDFALLDPALERVPLRLDHLLIGADEPITHAYFIEDGLISVVVDATRSQGGRIEVGIIGAEGFAGTPLVLGADRSPHAALVQTEGSALRIAAADLQIALHKSPSIRGVLGRFVQALIVQISHSVYANAELNVEGRLARWLLMAQDRLDRDEMPFTHKFLSLMLGVRRPSVTMALQLLEGEGMIKARRSHIAVTDREKLLRFVGNSYGMPEKEYERLLRRV